MICAYPYLINWWSMKKTASLDPFNPMMVCLFLLIIYHRNKQQVCLRLKTNAYMLSFKRTLFMEKLFLLLEKQLILCMLSLLDLSNTSQSNIKVAYNSLNDKLNMFLHDVFKRVLLVGIIEFIQLIFI